MTRGRQSRAEPASSYAPAHDVNGDALARLRTDMLRFASLQLRDGSIAEDIVQESIEAALRGAATFTGQSTLKTWVFSILRNRIIDHLRQARRTVPISSLVEDDDTWQERVAIMFDDRGGWRGEIRPSAWPDPEQALKTKQFWAVFEACLQHLPESTARVFMMREFLGLESGEICEQLALSTSNLHVILHRARMKLRDCVDVTWGKTV